VEVAGDNDTYEEELAIDSDDDCPVGCLSAREIEILKRVLPGRDPLFPDFEDLSHWQREIIDGGPSDTTVPDVSGFTIIRKGILFATMDDLKSWLQEYSIVHNHLYRVMNSFQERRYTVACEERCGRKVCARIMKADQWKITSVKLSNHMFAPQQRHKRTTCSSIVGSLQGNCAPVVKHMPTIMVSTLVEIIFQQYNYYVKYGKAWRAKQRSLELTFGDWEQAYERLILMLNAMKAANPGMHFEYLPQ
jgi:hypothetical protein